MAWFNRVREERSPTPAPPAPVDDGLESPDELRRSADELNTYVNSHAGRLPGIAVVNARRITDTLRETIDTSEIRALDVYAVLSVRATLGDYLPTTLKTYLAVDEALRDAPRATGRTPTQSLLEQLAALQSSATATLVAARTQDADALMTQGAFLQTKFSGSDLDL